MVEVSDELRTRLTREGKHEAKRQLDHVNKGPASSTDALGRQVVADALREEGQGHRPLPRSVSPGKLETRMRKTARYTKNGAALLMLVISR